MNALRKIVKSKKARNWGIVAIFVYYFLYYFSIGYIKFGSFGNTPNIFILSNWTDLIFKPIAPFLFEPIGYLELFNAIQFWISVPNILIADILSILVFINISAAIYMFSLPKQCRMDVKYKGLIGILPSFLTGFACCTPIFLIPLVSVLGSTTAFISRFFRWLLPISILLLVYGAVSSLRKIDKVENNL